VTDDTGAIDEAFEGAGDGADRIVLTGGGATGCGAANRVADVVVDVVGGGENAVNGFAWLGAGAGDVADWKSSKSSSPAAVLLCNVPKSSMAFEAGPTPLLGPDMAAGSSLSKLKRSFSGSFFFGGAAAAGLLSLFARLVLVVAAGLLVDELCSASPASYSS